MGPRSSRASAGTRLDEAGLRGDDHRPDAVPDTELEEHARRRTCSRGQWPGAMIAVGRFADDSPGCRNTKLGGARARKGHRSRSKNAVPYRLGTRAGRRPPTGLRTSGGHPGPLLKRSNRPRPAPPCPASSLARRQAVVQEACAPALGPVRGPASLPTERSRHSARPTGRGAQRRRPRNHADRRDANSRSRR